MTSANGLSGHERDSRAALRFRALLGGVTLLSSACTVWFGDRVATDGGADGPGCLCNAPPKDACLDATVLRAYLSAGACERTVCTYAHWDVLCENGCSNGACVGNDPCDGVQCTTPPSAACSAPTTLTTYSSAGTCSMGKCGYTSRQTSCSCYNGTCADDPCAGVTCDQPPAATCASTTTKRTYAAAGTCQNGRCVYNYSDSLCPVPANADPVCTGGVCDFTCHTGFSRVGMNCVGACGRGSWTSCISNNYDTISCENYCKSIGKCCSNTCPSFDGSGPVGSWGNWFTSACAENDVGSVAADTCTGSAGWSSQFWFACCCS